MPFQRQSPINLQPVLRVALDSLQYDYKPGPLTVVHNGHTLQVDHTSGSTLTLDGELYKLEELYFQTPSEHTVSAVPYAMEVQLVHRHGDHVVIMAILIELGEANSAIQKIWEYMPSQSGPKKTFNNVTVNVADLLPANLEAYYRYSGSLTDPPYRENVTWIVMKEPIAVSVDQLEQFINAMGQTARPVQPRHHRLILEAM
jgi:carbonic anhydrase